MLNFILKLIMKQKYATVISIIFIFLLGYVWFIRSEHKDKVSRLWNNIKSANELIEEANGSISKLTQKLDNKNKIENILTERISFLSDSLNDIWNLKVKDLLKIVKQKNEDLKGTTTLIAGYDNLVDSLVNVKQETTKAGRYKVSFEKQFNTIFVKGYTLTNPAYSWINIQRSPLAMNLTITETKEKNHKVYATFSDPNLRIKDINTNFIGFQEEHNFWYYMKNLPRASVGIFQDEAYLSAGFRIWRMEPRFRATSNGFSSGVEFHLFK